MTSTSIKVERSTPIDAAVISDLGEAMAMHIVDGEDSLADAPVIREHLARADANGRTELQRFVHNVDIELTRIPKNPDDEAATSARRELAIAVHPVQVDSKLWLIDELSRHCDLSRHPLLVLGGWYGVLPLLVNWRINTPPTRMLCVDNDPAACEIGARMIGTLYPNIQYLCADVMDLDYTECLNEPPTIVVNTICEHLANPGQWWARIPSRSLVALQSNNYEICPDHVSCVHDLAQFETQMPMSERLAGGVLQFPQLDPQLDRFMLIGRR